MPKNVVIVTNIPSPYRVDLFEYMKQNNSEYRITVVYQNRGNFDRSWKIEESQTSQDVFLDAFTLRVRDRFDQKVLRFPRGVWKNFRRLKPDVVVISEYNPVSLMVMLWCRLHKVRYISWTDGTIEYEKGISSLQRLSRHLIIGHADAYIASSTEAKRNQLMYGARNDKIFVSYLTVDTSPLYYQRREFQKKRLLFVGRLVETKGIDLLLNALCKLKEKDFSLTIVGDGADEKKLRTRAAELGLGEKVIFAGFHEGEELRQYYRECDIFVFPSRRETYGLAVLEAMCHSMPVVCSKYAGCASDLLENGKNGFVVNPYQAQELAQAVNRLLMDECLVEQMGKAAYQKAEQFSIASSAASFLQPVREIL